MIFSFKNIYYAYKSSIESQYALENVSFTIESHKITALAGENGGGKTTIIKVLLGRLLQYKGEYEIDGKKMTDSTGSIASLYKIGYSSDVPALDDALTGQDILEIVGEIRKSIPEKIKFDIEQFCNYLMIEKWIKSKKCSEYSTGMRKKISIALAYIGSPQFVVLDEPLNGLDPLAIHGLRQLIQEKRKEGIGTLISSHLLNFTDKIADDILLLYKGEAKYFGSIRDLKSAYNDADLEEIYFNIYKKKNDKYTAQ